MAPVLRTGAIYSAKARWKKSSPKLAMRQARWRGRDEQWRNKSLRLIADALTYLQNHIDSLPEAGVL